MRPSPRDKQEQPPQLGPGEHDRRLWRACRQGDSEGALRALADGASGWLQDLHGDSALSMAAQCVDDAKAARCVEAIAVHCNPNSRDAFDRTPLMLAASMGNAMATRALRPFCDPLATDASGLMAFQLAEQAGFRPLAIELLAWARSARERALLAAAPSVASSRPPRL